MKEQTVHLGFEIGSGEPIAVPMRHMAVTGQTQRSGKTTTLEALISRSGSTALTFLTKRGERSFESGRRVQPYFRDRADWQFVDQLLEAVLGEKNKMLRAPIIKICRNTQSLADVQTEVKEALETARGFYEGAFTQLDAYLDLVVPEIERAELADALDLRPGVNVMDLTEFATPMQMLFIQSALDWVNDNCRNTTVVIPEAWEFVPEGKGSPVKASAVTLVRKGAVLNNYIWLDSQDMAGVDKTILRGCTVWLVGVQREANEIKRNLLNIPAGIKRPKPEDISGLERGQFFACFDKTIAKVYVQPTWMDAATAATAATTGEMPEQAAPPAAPAPTQSPAPKEDEVDKATADALIAENDRLKGEIAAAEERGYKRGLVAAQASFEAFKANVSMTVDNFAKNLMSNISSETPSRIHDVSLIERPAAPAQLDTSKRAPARPVSTSDKNPAGLKLLAGLARYSETPIAWDDAAMVAGMAAGNGYFYGGRKWLLLCGYVEEVDGNVRATPAGLEVVGGAQKPLTRAELVGMWTGKIGEPGSRILAYLAKHPNKSFPATEVAEQINVKPGNGYWYRGVASVREPGLIVQEDKTLRLSTFLKSARA
ncbi:hypothetical protein [Bradyrhizobium cenepequi]